MPEAIEIDKVFSFSWMLDRFYSVITFENPVSSVLNQLLLSETLKFQFSMWEAHVSDGVTGFFYYESGLKNLY